MTDYEIKNKNAGIAKERYADYSEKIQEYMQSIIDDLSKSDANFPSSFYITLDLLASNLDIYDKAREAVTSGSLTCTDNYGHTTKSPYYYLMITSQAHIEGLLKSLGQNPLSKSKKNNLDKRGTVEFNTNEYLDDLLG